MKALSFRYLEWIPAFAGATHFSAVRISLATRLHAELGRSVLPLLVAGALTGGFLLGSPTADATNLPPGVMNYIQQKDPKVQVRFDGVVIFSNGNTYLPVIPQDPEINPDPVGVINTIPDKTPYPDLIQFDNNFFLLRMIQTSSGRLTLPKLANMPVQLKEGLLPQDLVIPSQLFIPDELKIILGELPYHPTLDAANPTVPAAHTLKQPMLAAQAASGQSAQKLIYTYSMDDQALVPVDLNQGERLEKIGLGCMASTMLASTDNKALYVGCLSSNELLAVDLASSLIKVRVALPAKPTDLLALKGIPYLLVSSRYSDTVSIINTQELLPPEQGNMQIKLPGSPGVMADYSTQQVLVADAYQDRIYQVNLKGRSVERTLIALPEISAMWLYAPGNRRPELWVASKSTHQVRVLDLISGNPIATLDVGKRPVAMAAMGDKLYVLCATGEQVDVLDMNTHAHLQTVTMPQGSFPTAMAISPEEQRLYVGGAGQEGLVSVDLSRHEIDARVPVNVRSFALALPTSSGHAKGLPMIEAVPSSGANSPAPDSGSTTPPVNAQYAEQSKPTASPSEQTALDALPIDETSASNNTTTEDKAEDSSIESEKDKASAWLKPLRPVKIQSPAKADQPASTSEQADTASSKADGKPQGISPINMTMTATPSALGITGPGGMSEIKMTELKSVSKKLFKKWGNATQSNAENAEPDQTSATVLPTGQRLPVSGKFSGQPAAEPAELIPGGPSTQDDILK